MGNGQRGAGGTPGGLGSFFLGLIMALSGGYMLLNQVQVSTGFWGFRYRLFGGVGVSAFGVTMVVFLIGIGILFYDADSWLGYIVAGAAFLVMIVGIIANLQVYFVQTSLYVILVMLILLVGGIGLILRSFRPFG